MRKNKNKLNIEKFCYEIGENVLVFNQKTGKWVQGKILEYFQFSKNTEPHWKVKTSKMFTRNGKVEFYERIIKGYNGFLKTIDFPYKFKIGEKLFLTNSDKPLFVINLGLVDKDEDINNPIYLVYDKYNQRKRLIGEQKLTRTY